MKKDEIDKNISKDVDKSYGVGNIDVLEGVEGIRKRPGMYIGGIDAKGLHHLVWEVIDNSVDEVLAGFATKVEVVLYKDGSIMIEDNGRGIPTDIHPKTGVSTVETVFTKLHSGGKFGGATSGYKVAGGLHGVGVTVTNALSANLDVSVFRNGNEYKMSFAKGIPVTKLAIVGESDKIGTRIHFKPDETIFESTEFSYERIKDRIKNSAFLNKGLSISFFDMRNNIKVEYYYEGGIVDFLKEKNKDEDLIHENVLYAENTVDNIQVEVALQYIKEDNESIASFVNSVTTNEGGTHVLGLFDAIFRIFNKYGVERNLYKNVGGKLIYDDIKVGLTAIVSIKHPDPVYEGQTKQKLSNTEVRKIVNDAISVEIEKFLLENPQTALEIIEKCIKSARDRLAFEKFKKERKKINQTGGSLPGKLADASSKDPKVKEIFIVEGDSAGGSAKQGRNREIQAILPLRGKVLNTEKASIEQAEHNNEIKTIVNALGTFSGKFFDIEKLRYYKIIIMTDADVDGSHIRILLLTFFYRHMKQLIEKGHIYIAQPPLFKIVHGKEISYAYSDKERDEIISSRSTKPSNIQRYKGLGEMNYDQLWETTMNPASRVLLKVNIEDARRADEMFKVLMGKESDLRNDFIMSNAKFVKVLDL